MSTSKRVEDARASELGLELWLLRGAGDLRDEVHAELRRLLGERLGVAGDELEFVHEPCPLCGELHGRPAIKQGGIHFWIARRSGVALIGIAGAAAIAAPVAAATIAVPAPVKRSAQVVTTSRPG